MIIVPIIGKISLRNPPVITIGLILLNVFVYFGLQLGDRAAQASAQRFYVESGLAGIELPRYQIYREGAAAPEAVPGGAAGRGLLLQSFRDGRFQSALDADEIITPEDPVYEKWKPLRAAFLQRWESAVAVRWGFRPSVGRPETALTYMFLHGGIGHLVGNMVFLWLVGCILEYGAGRVRYLAIYLLGGLAAVAAFYAAQRHSAVPLVGASGAIAALMGALAILFGKTRIRVFFSIGFYFNTFRILAIYLLPLWVGNELFQLFFGGASQVAYTAHIGGLLGGAGIAALTRGGRRAVDADALGGGGEDTVSPVLEAAMTHMEKLEFGSARRLLAALHREAPENPDVLRLLFAIDRHFPERPAIHATASAYLKMLSRDLDRRDQLVGSYERYVSAVKTPKLPPDLLLAVGRALIANRRPQAAENVLSAIPAAQAEPPGLAAAWQRLADVWEGCDRPARAARCREVLLRRFPASPEAAEIRHS